MLDFSPEAYRRLQRLRQVSDARTNAEVVKNALRIYDWLVEQRKQKRTLQVVTPEGAKDVEFLF